MSIRLAHSLFSTAGRGGPTPAVILHGLFGSGNNWRTIAGRIASETNRLVYTVDARNHGETAHTSEMTYDLMSQDTLKFIRDQGLERVVLIGHSMGGKTAMVTALNHPEVIEKLVVVDVSPQRAPGKRESTDLIGAMKNLDIMSLRNRREADLILKKDIKEFSLRQFLLTNLVTNGYGNHNGGGGNINATSVGNGDSMRWKVNLDTIAASIQSLKDFPHFETTYDNPTLFIGGGDSNYITMEDAPRINQLFPDARIKHIGGAGHWAHFEKPAEFLRLVKEFLSDSNTR